MTDTLPPPRAWALPIPAMAGGGDYLRSTPSAENDAVTLAWEPLYDKAAVIAVRDAAVAAERERWAPLHSAVDDLMAFMGYHGSANARGDHAQAVMDALHALDAAMAGARAGTILPT